MSFVHSKSTRVLINELTASAKLRSIIAAHTRTMSPTTTFVDQGERFIPGLMAGTVTLEGLFEDDALLDELVAAMGVDNSLLVTAGFGGYALGAPVATAVGDLASHTITSAVADAVGFTVESPSDETVDLGVSLHDETAETATGDGLNVDNLVASTNGGVGVLHVTVASVADTLDVKIQHSVDNSVWVDLVTFAQVTAVTSERKTVAGTVNRHLRARRTIAGTTPSFTYVAAFARR